MREKLRNFLLSLPERGVRSVTALAGGVVRELGEVSIPQTIRRGQLYRNLVEATLRFLIEQVGQVKGVYPSEEKLARISWFAAPRVTGSNWLESWPSAPRLFGSWPPWLMPREPVVISSMKSLVHSKTRACWTAPPKSRRWMTCSMGSKRLQGAWQPPSIPRRSISRPCARNGPLSAAICPGFPQSNSRAWTRFAPCGRHQTRGTETRPDCISGLLAHGDVGHCERSRKGPLVSASARSAARKAGSTVAAVLLEDYRTTLQHIRDTGYLHYAARQFRPYLLRPCPNSHPAKAPSPRDY